MTLRVIELAWLACCIVRAVMTVCLKGQCVKPSCSLLQKIHQVASCQWRWALTIRFQCRLPSWDLCIDISAIAFKPCLICHPTHEYTFTSFVVSWYVLLLLFVDLICIIVHVLIMLMVYAKQLCSPKKTLYKWLLF